MVVLPAPVGPTIAIVWPGRTCRLKSVMSGLSASYLKFTCSSATWPLTSPRSAPVSTSGASSSASRSSKTRSADARPDCSRFIWPAICMIGMVNWREYWMKAWTSPSVIVPEATR